VADAEVTERLDTIIALLNLAFSEPIGRARKAVLDDPVAAAVLDAVGAGALSAGELKKTVAATTNQSERTVQRRITTLVSERVIEQIGSGPRTSYRATGLFAAPARRSGGSGNAGRSASDE
jgi:bifunctional ADP-heptose synthase (sugar kinase/adenylyltransferase)